MRPPQALAAACLVAACLLTSSAEAAPSWAAWARGGAAQAEGGPRGASSSEDADANGGTCFEEDCRSSPFIMHASSTTNTSDGGVASCFKFVAIGCYAAPKGCCPAVARRFSGLEFAISESPVPPALCTLFLL